MVVNTFWGENEAIIYLPGESFNVSPTNPLDEGGSLNKLLTLMVQTLKLLAQTLVGLGTVVFFVVFIILVVTDLVFSRGQSLFLSRFGRTRALRTGFVFDARTNRGVPFALITAQGTSEQGEQVLVTSVTDVNGKYDCIALPRGEYTLQVSCEGFRFPTRISRPNAIVSENFYKGEPIQVVASEQLIDPMIPMDKLTAGQENSHVSWRTQALRTLWMHWQRLRRLQPYFEVTLLVASIIGLFLHPNWIYIVTGIFYGGLVISRLWQILRRSSLNGRVVDNNGAPVPGAVVEIYQNTGEDSDESRHAILGVADEQGRFNVNLKPGDYRARAKKNGYVSPNSARTVNSDEVITITGQAQNQTLKLIKMPKLTEDFFFQDDDTVVDENASAQDTKEPEITPNSIQS